MLHPVAGSRIFIADSPAAPGGTPAPAWVEIGETEALGLLGGEWGLIDVTCFGSVGKDGVPGREFLKGAFGHSPMQIVFGNDPTDAGQIRLWKAFKSDDAFLFRLVFPGGTIAREWRGFVTAMSEVFDTANSVIKLQADILPQSEIWRSEDG